MHQVWTSGNKKRRGSVPPDEANKEWCVIKTAVEAACTRLDQALEGGVVSGTPSLQGLLRDGGVTTPEGVWGWNKAFGHAVVLEAVFEEQARVATGLRATLAGLLGALSTA